MSIAELQKTTLEELVASPDRGRYELVHGFLVEVPMGSLASAVGSRLNARLQIHCETTKQAEAFNSEQYYRCFGEDDHARKPDVSVVRKSRLPGGWTAMGYFTF